MLHLIRKDSTLQDRLRAVDTDDAVIDFDGLDQRAQISFSKGNIAFGDVLTHESAEAHDLGGVELCDGPLAFDFAAKEIVDALKRRLWPFVRVTL